MIRFWTWWYDHALPAATEREVELAHELSEQLRSLPAEDEGDGPKPERRWKKYVNMVRELGITDSPREFLRWEPILSTMFVKRGRCVDVELAALHARPDWAEIWESVVREVPTGHPLPYYRHPASSGNRIHNAYHVSRIEDELGRPVADYGEVIEFGGGYGCLCHVAFARGFSGGYTIFDYPLFSAIQKYYLKCLGLPAGVTPPDERGIELVSDMGRFQRLLAGPPATEPSLFVANWSLSETPQHIRDAVLPRVPGRFDAVMMAFQDHFEEMDNRALFGAYCDEYASEIEWRIEPIAQLPGNSYLFGKRCDDKKPDGHARNPG